MSENADGQKQPQPDSTKKQAKIFIAVSVLFFIVSMTLVGINNAKIREYENRYIRTQAIITGVRTEHYIQQGTHRTKNTYYFILTFSLNGNEYTAKDAAGHEAFDRNMLGSEVEIYVDPQSPETALRVTNSDLFSLISVCLFAFFIITYSVGGSMLLYAQKRGFKHRAIFVWLPLFVVCLAVCASFLALPYAQAVEAFTHVRALTAYTVFGGAAAIVCLADGLISQKNKRKNLLHE